MNLTPFFCFMIEAFVHYLSFEKRFSPHTVIAYQKDIEQFYEAALMRDELIKTVNYRMVRNYMVDLIEDGLENSTVNRKLSSLKTFFKFLKREGKIEVNPMQKIQGLKQKKHLPQFVPENQLWDKSTFNDYDHDHLNLRDELILEMFYQTGIRLSELINLKVTDINISQIKVLGKRNKERIIPIAKPLFDSVDFYLQQRLSEGISTPFLFCTENGKKLSSKFVYSKVNYYLSKVTNLKKKSPHVLRHTFATHMLNNGASLESIKNLLGHTDLAATQIYTHNSFKQIKNIYKTSHPRGGE